MVVMVVTCFASCSSNIQDDNIQDNNGNKTKSNPSEITIGYNESLDANSKPLTSQRIALKCMSFYEKNEKVIVDAAMGDQYSFGWFYYHDNPENQYQPDNSWCGMRRSLYFYIGESGISLSFNSVDNAKDEYDNHLSTADNANADAICAAKPLYLLCIDNNNIQYSHGSIIERQFEITGFFSEDQRL